MNDNNDEPTTDAQGRELHLSAEGIIDGHPNITREEMQHIHGKPRFENDERVVFADTRGYEYDEYMTAFRDAGYSTAKVSDKLHELAREHTPNDGIDHWPAAYPLVFDKRGDGFGKDGGNG
jgi:hypothetical protein